MPRQGPESAISAEQRLRGPGEATAKANGGGDQLQLLLLRRQIADLERRIDQLTAGERKARTEQLEALAASQASAKEQARLHEELAARERTVSELIANDAKLKQEIARARAQLTSQPGQGPQRSAIAPRRREDGFDFAQRVRLLSFLAEQLREQRRQVLRIRAALDASPVSRKAIEAAFEARRASSEAEQRRQSERIQAWQSGVRSGPGGPRRRNRPKKLMEKILCRFGPPGVAVVLSGSGLWNTAFKADTTPSLKRTSLMGYASARPDAGVPVAALFDQAWYLAANPAVAGSRIPPLAHYLLYGDREGRSPHPLVDVRFYRHQNRHELGATGLTALQHFLFKGANEGRNPHPLFDVRYYVGQLSDPDDLAMNPLVHYLRMGWRRGLNPHPLFDNDSYLQRYPEAAASMMPPLLHYVTIGARQGLDPHPLFSARWYETTYPDVIAAGLTPLEHYATTSPVDRRRPSPDFDVDHYLEQAPDAHSRGVNVLQHYLEVGALRGLSPNKAFDCFAFIQKNPDALDDRRTPFEVWLASRQSPEPEVDRPTRVIMEQIFDPAWYIAQAHEIMDPAENPLDHYLRTGWRFDLNPHPLFDTTWYLSRYPDVLESGLSPLLHFVTIGVEELRDPHPLFDSRWYAERYPDIGKDREIPFVHYLYFGAREGRSPSPLFDAGAYLRAYPDVKGENPLLHFLTRWPKDNRPNGFVSEAATSPHGADVAEWVAGLADGLRRANRP